MLKFCFVLLSCVVGISCSSKYTVLRPIVVQIVEPFVELRSEPEDDSRNFYAIEKNELILVFDSYDNFFQVKTKAGQQGWISKDDLLKTKSRDGNSLVANQYGLIEFAQ